MVTNSGIFSTSTSITYLFKNFLSITRIFKAYLSKSQHKLKPFVWSVNLYSLDIVLKLLIVLFVLMMKYVPFLPKGGGIFSTPTKHIIFVQMQWWNLFHPYKTHHLSSMVEFFHPYKTHHFSSNKMVEFFHPYTTHHISSKIMVEFFHPY